MDESAGASDTRAPSRRSPASPPDAPARDSRSTGATAAASTPRDLPTAIAVGFGIAAVFIGALLWKPVAVLAIIVLLLGFAGVEFFDRVTDKGYRPVSIVGIAACVGAPLVAYWAHERGLPLVLAFAFIAAAVAFVSADSVQSGPLPNMAITGFGVLWIGLLGSYAALIISVSNGPPTTTSAPTRCSSWRSASWPTTSAPTSSVRPPAARRCGRGSVRTRPSKA